jgi:hypothetical protein
MTTSLEKNLRPLPRTLSEANRDAEYATAIQRHTPEWRHGIEWFAELAQFLFYGGLGLVVPIVIYVWLTK